MRGTHWGKGTIGLQAAVPKKPHRRPLTFNMVNIVRDGQSWNIGLIATEF
jgi:hypothetical protein